MTLGHLILRYAHISMGMVALLSGAGAMVFRKGSLLHKRAGDVFVVSMLIMAGTGLWISIFIALTLPNIMGASVTIYMVTTGWLAGWRPPGQTGRLELAALAWGLGVVCLGATFGILAMQSGVGKLDGYPTQFYFIFGSIALFGTLLDLRMIARGGLTGAARTTRHLWRMCFAMFFATASFFLGQAKLFPVEWRAPLRIPVLLVVLGLFYWLIRVRVVPLLRRIRAPKIRRSISAR